MYIIFNDNIQYLLFMQSLLIAFDITALAEPKTGIGQYRWNLLKELRAQSSEFSIIPYGFNFRGFGELQKIKNDSLFSILHSPFSIFKIPRRPLIMSWIFLRAPKLERFVKNFDVAHVSDNCQTPTKKPTVATIHDLSAIMFPDFHSSKNSFVDKYRFKQMAKYASQIICVSENSKNDFLERYKFDKDRIHTVYNGIDHDKFFPIKDFQKIQKIKEKYNLFHPFILFLGTIEPRKNILRLIKAYFELKNQQKIIQKLVICGKKGWFYEEIFAFVKENKLEEDVIFLGYIDENDKNAFINASDFVVYPSLYEGFGFPVIEAMAAGKAIITANNSSLPEVGGKAAIYVNAEDANDMADKMYMLCKNLELKQELEKAGLIQAKQFSWQRCARETIAVYKKALQN